MRRQLVLITAFGGALAFFAPAHAQSSTLPGGPAQSASDASRGTGDSDNAKALADAEAKIKLLQAQVKALQASIEEVKTSMGELNQRPKITPALEDKQSGFTFKPKGLIQWDAGYNGYPRGNQLRGTVSGINFQDLGWNSRARRLTLGAEGTLPGGFRYNAEVNFAQGSVDYEDIFIAYDFPNVPVTAQVGNIYPFSSLETMTSSKVTSFLERAGFTDAFNYNRRLGIAFSANDRKLDRWTFQAGIFNEPINNGDFTRTGWQASARGVFSPTVGEARLHFGANYQHRVNTRELLAQTYQERPLNQITNQRFVNTGNIASQGDDVVGVEFGARLKSFHVASEAQKLWVRHAYDASEIAAQNAVDNSNNTIPAGAVALNGNPGFTGGYAELGYYFTGETRGYKNGAWAHTKVLHPLNEGGWGALEINGRIDYVELRDRVDNSSPSLAAPYYVNGGRQVGYEGSLIWDPTNSVRLIAQYAHIDVTGGPTATAAVPGPPPIPGIFPEGTTRPINKRKYGVDTFGARAQVDF